MKFKKFFLGVVIGILAVASLALGACSNGGGNDDEGKDDGPVTISYQLSGVMDGEDLDSFSFAKGAFWLKLMSDGSIVMDRYNFGNYNTSPAAENDDYVQNYMQGEWEKTTRDGVEALSIEIYVLNEAGIKTQSSSATAYNSNGTYTCSLRMEVVSGAGFFRQVSFSGGTTLYADADEFIEKNAKEFVAPDSVAIFTDEKNGGTVYLQEDGTVLIYSGYSQAASGTWANDKAGNMTVTVAGTPITVTVDTAADTATFAYEYAIYGDYKINFTFTAKYSVIPDFSAVVQENTYTGTYGEQIWTLTLTDDTNCTISTTMMGFTVPFSGTYAKDANGIVTITCNPDNEQLQGIWAGVSNVKWQLNDEDHSMTAVVEEA